MRPRWPETAGFDWKRISSVAATEAAAVAVAVAAAAVAAADRAGDGGDDGVGTADGTATTTTRTTRTVVAGAVTLRPLRLACFDTGECWPGTTAGRGRNTCGIDADDCGPA